MSKRVGMPSIGALVRYWDGTALPALKGFDSREDMVGICLACGWEKPLQRCHIVALHDGGSNAPSNLVPMCGVCHTESEGLSEVMWWRWFWAMNQYKRLRVTFEQFGDCVEATL